MIISITFLYLFFILLFFLILLQNIPKNNIYFDLAVAIISCNRYEYLNASISSIYHHFKYYEKNVNSNFIHFDQGTPNREIFSNKYSINNAFYMNPNGYPYSFKILFSYLYSQFVLLLEEDWIIIHNIENKIKYNSFLYLSMKLLLNTNLIYGLYLRKHPKGLSTKRIYKEYNVTYYEVYEPWMGCCYTNGASIYNSKYLKKMSYKESEFLTTLQCIKFDFHIGYIYWEYIDSCNGIEYPFMHIGKRSTRKGMCNISLY